MLNKKLSNSSILIATAIVLVAVVFAVINISKPHPESEMMDTQPSFLFMQTAHSGTLSLAKADGTRTLTLKDVSPVTVYFSERPDRETGHQSTAEFIAEWSAGEDSFEANPPNAALDIIGDDSQSIAIVELMSAKYNSADQTLEYEILMLDDETAGAIPQSFDEAALFIDSTHKDYHCICWPEKGHKTCSCDYKYTLGKSATKEFRGYCDNILATYERIDIQGLSKDTTCTGNFPWDGYITKSCTNWSPLKKDKVRISLHCKPL